MLTGILSRIIYSTSLRLIGRIQKNSRFYNSSRRCWGGRTREQAGLARPGASGASARLRVPGSPMHRTPSTPSLATEFRDNGAASKESLAELWSNFLEQESQASSHDNSPSTK
ncbi:hypothetical protein BDW67DRAFT_93361 [Aspergillus spinulosporus]